MTSSPSLPLRAVGDTGLHVTELGFGAASLGNAGRAIADDVARDAVAAAWAAGIRYFDTAPFYGRGLSERRLGDALRGQEDDALVLSSKVGRVLVPDASVGRGGEVDGFLSPMPFRVTHDYSRDGILRSFEASLHRLGLDRIDMLFVHDIGRWSRGDAHDEGWAQLTRGGGFEALASLREQGAIRAFGLGVNEVEICLEAIDAAPVDVLLLANRYTLLEQAPLDALFPACAARGIAVIAGAPYNSGILATGTRGSATPHYDYAPAPADIVARVRRIEAVADAWKVPLAAAALQFPLIHPCVVSVLPGIGDRRRLDQTMDLYAREIPAGFWTDLVSEGLIRADSLNAAAIEKAMP
ncbi:aldo/keto reductase [Sphingomonas sp. NPDC019816]|uniref:aldo/keto reductase n=1 Tax=Sphingomonas sp. NPDC019816 TaxID=3390679 RepID=UPI003CFF95C6